MSIRVLVIDVESACLDFVLRCVKAGHEVRWYRWSKPGHVVHDGRGMNLTIVDDWRQSMPWAKDGLIVCTGNFVHLHNLDRFRDLGYKIFGPTVASAKLEIERAVGMDAMRAVGIEVPPYQTFDSMQAAEAFARKSDRAWVFKPMGDAEDKSLTYVSRDPADLVGWIRRQTALGKKLKGPVMLQEKVDRLCEIGVSGWMGPDGFLPGKFQICFEHKPLMDGDVGPATGEQGCYSADTEVLTSEGWKFWPDVIEQDELATLVDGKLTFEKPTALVEYQISGRMIQWKNRSVDILVTPNHNMYVAGQSGARRREPKFKFVLADDCMEAQYLLNRTADWEGSSPEHYVLSGHNWHTGIGPRCTKDVVIPFRDWCAFLGIYFAEGSVDSSSAVIAQSHPEKCNKVGEILVRLPLNVTSSDHGFRVGSRALMRVLNPFGRSYEKRVPDYIKNARTDDIAAFLDAFAIGDGHTQSNGSRMFYTSNRGLADDLQELMLRCGRLGIIKTLKRRTKFGTINGRPIIQRRTAYVVFERARKITGWLDRRDRQEVHYAGSVYCATVSSHVLFVRRNGKPVWCGNTVTQYVDKDKLAEEMLLPMEPVLRTLGHRGDFAVGAMLDTKGRAWPLEFTARLGYPAFYIQIASHRGDPAKWMLDLLNGKDTLRVSQDVAIGVVMAQPRYPFNISPPEMVEGIPIHGLEDVWSDIHPVSVMMGKGPVMEDGKVVERPVHQTSGELVLVATGLGPTVSKARKKVYDVVDEVHFPDAMYRTDIGEKLEDCLPKVRRFGYASETFY